MTLFVADNGEWLAWVQYTSICQESFIINTAFIIKWDAQELDKRNTCSNALSIHRYIMYIIRHCFYNIEWDTYTM